MLTPHRPCCIVTSVWLIWLTSTREVTLEKAEAKPPYRKLDPSKHRVSLDLDRKLWRKYRAMMLERGETLTNRIQFLVQKDINELKSGNTAS